LDTRSKHSFYDGKCVLILNLSVSEYKHIVRIAGKDIDGSKKIIVALSEIKGVGYNFAQVILQSMNVNPNVRIGFLTDREITEIETVIRNPSQTGIPKWYLNRQKDMDSGSNHHLITSDLDFSISNDIEREKSVMSWRGYRHMFGLKVRGQCTRTTGRRGGAVGVKKTGKPLLAATSTTTMGTQTAVTTTPSKTTNDTQTSNAQDAD
jgi:small subunit ribosomal protein S13